MIPSTFVLYLNIHIFIKDIEYFNQNNCQQAWLLTVIRCLINLMTNESWICITIKTCPEDLFGEICHFQVFVYNLSIPQNKHFQIEKTIVVHI